MIHIFTCISTLLSWISCLMNNPPFPPFQRGTPPNPHWSRPPTPRIGELQTCVYIDPKDPNIDCIHFNILQLHTTYVYKHIIITSHCPGCSKQKLIDTKDSSGPPCGTVGLGRKKKKHCPCD